MQKLNQRRLDSRVCVLKNMVGADDVDDSLQQEITGSKRNLPVLIVKKGVENFSRGMFEVRWSD